MHVFFDLFGLQIPGYGLMIALGVILADIISFIFLKKFHRDLNDFIILEAYAFLGAFLGAKVLFFIVSYKDIDWSRFFEAKYFNQLMQGGFVFYGGLIGALICLALAAKLHKIPAFDYLKDFTFIIPFMHCFGRLGCYMAGCCYGISYHGFGSVVFPEESLAPAGVELFPIQLVEAFGLFAIAIVLFILKVKMNYKFTIEVYLVSYSVLRFVLEFFRADEERGAFGIFSTSQWISIFLFIAAFFVYRKNKSKLNKKS